MLHILSCLSSLLNICFIYLYINSFFLIQLLIYKYENSFEFDGMILQEHAWRFREQMFLLTRVVVQWVLSWNSLRLEMWVITDIMQHTAQIRWQNAVCQNLGLLSNKMSATQEASCPQEHSTVKFVPPNTDHQLSNKHKPLLKKCERMRIGADNPLIFPLLIAYIMLEDFNYRIHYSIAKWWSKRPLDLLVLHLGD